MRLVWLAAAILTIQPLVAQSTAGLDATVLSRFDADIASGKYGNVDSVLILHHGEVAFDRTYNHDYRTIYADAEKKAQTWSHLDPGVPTVTSIHGGTPTFVTPASCTRSSPSPRPYSPWLLESPPPAGSFLRSIRLS